MSAGTSLPADFTPDVQVALPYAIQVFVARSLEAATIVGGPGSGAPFETAGDMGLAGGGRYIDGPIFKRTLTSNRRDITSVSGLTADKIVGANNKGVRMDRRSNLVAFSDAVDLMGLTPAQISARLGAELGDVVFDGVLTTLIKACIGAIEAVSTTHVKTLWAADDRALLTPTAIESGRSILGDRRKAINSMITRSESGIDLRNDAYGRAFDAVAGRALSGAENTNTLGINRMMERDESALLVADAGFDKYITLLLSAGFLQWGFAKPIEIETDRDITTENKRTLWRADWAIWLRIPSMEYDSADGGANPSDTALATAANWIDNTTSHKEVGAVELILNSSLGS